MARGSNSPEDTPIQQSGAYRAWSLALGPRGVIDLAWHSRIEHGRPERHRLLPFHEPSLAICRRFDRDGNTENARFVIYRAQADGGIYDPVPGEEIFALRLAPEWMEIALGLKASEFAEQDRELPRALAALLDRARSRVGQDRFRDAWREMAMSLAQSSKAGSQDRIAYAASLSRAAKGSLDPAELAERAGLSQRHMRRGFVDRFGLSPRSMARRMRLTTALLEADRQQRPPWAEIAAGYGYSDQPHLIRECRAIMGESPGELHTLRRSVAVSFNT